MKTAADTIAEALNGLVPRIALVLGSGLGGLVDAVGNAVRIPYENIEGFPQSGVSGHAGEVVAGTIGDKPVLLLSGRVHYYEKGDAAAMRPALEVLQGIGIEKLILTNAAGSLREDLAPGSVMVIEDHINFSGTNPLIGEESDRRFVGMTSAYDADMRATIERAAEAEGIAIDRGVYMWFSGPSFETPAEIRMARTLGADAVGMSTVPEVIIARFLGMSCAACSVITNYGAGMTGAELSHTETKDVAPIGGKKLQAILTRVIADM
ncbi:purine-nucleoside phosphorylase [Oricola thermophila]|uniref:Purine nucleoside phosphorylase n=1 Tax=Oricola thermophila TaxID=2742145 RepID=A0A6N1VFX2_9HYPH|nr:purine-nucleoside phosphorylase [Oricola thermophila]QKV19744.1 purine-nucleoside phosphorylase [Oricola thermophila]